MRYAIYMAVPAIYGAVHIQRHFVTMACRLGKISARWIMGAGRKTATNKRRSYNHKGCIRALGALMLARGEIHMPGVVAPEACIEPDPFLTELEKRGLAVQDMSGQWPAPTVTPARPWLNKVALAAVGALILLWWLLRRRRSE